MVQHYSKVIIINYKSASRVKNAHFHAFLEFSAILFSAKRYFRRYGIRRKRSFGDIVFGENVFGDMVLSDFRRYGFRRYVPDP